MANDEELIFITVLGRDRKGIIARISTYLSDSDINIVDVSQKITEGYFIMTMVSDISDTKKSLEQLKKELNNIAEELALQIQVHHKKLFIKMHRI